MYILGKNKVFLNIWKIDNLSLENNDKNINLSWIDFHFKCQEMAKHEFLTVYTPRASGEKLWLSHTHSKNFKLG